MQDAFSQDMFNISDLNNSRYNGHVQSCGIKATGGGSSGGLSVGLAGGGLGTGGKKDRKGCTKGKIEAIMKNNAVRAKVVMPLNVSTALSNASVKKSLSSNTSTTTTNHHHQQQSVVFLQNHQIQPSVHSSRHEVLRIKEEHDDPYAFTEPEPQSLGIYQAGGSTGTSKTKNVPVVSQVSTLQQHRSTNTVVTGDRSRNADKVQGVKVIKSSHHTHHGVTNASTVGQLTGHDHSRSAKVVQTVQEVANRSPRSVTKRKVPSVTLKGTSSSYMNQSHHQEQGSGKSSHHHHYHQHHHHNHHYYRKAQQTDRICLPAKRQPRKSVWQRERNAKHELLERIHGVQTKLASYNRDLYPLGIEISDSETDEFELERHAVYERHWFSRTDSDVSLFDDNFIKERSSHISTTGADEEESPRERRVEFARAETRRRLAQILAGVKSASGPSSELVAAVVRAARVVPNATAILLSLGKPQAVSTSNKLNRGARFLTTGEKCSYSEGCDNQALPATRHCLRHIMYNVDQRLFSHCTGRLEDNTQCNRPTFDPAHISPLCPLHIGQAQASAVRSSSDSRHNRKKSRVLGLSRNSKRNNKKKKKTSSPIDLLHDVHHNNNHHSHHSSNSHSRLGSSVIGGTSIVDDQLSTYISNNSLNSQQHLHQQQSLSEEHDTDSRSTTLGRLQHSVGTDTAGSPMSVSSTGAASQGDHLGATVTVGVDSIVGSAEDSLHDSTIQQRTHSDIVEEVLAIEALDPVELANQTRLLEEHDLNNVLNQISTDLAFNDLFTDKNGEYEPTREETEELERALEAVDNDVRSLERMTGALPLSLPLLQLPLEGLLDTTPNAGGTSSSPTGGSTNGGNFDTSVTSPQDVATFHNGYVDSPIVSATVVSNTMVSDTLNQTT